MILKSSCGRVSCGEKTVSENVAVFLCSNAYLDHNPEWTFSFCPRCNAYNVFFEKRLLPRKEERYLELTASKQHTGKAEPARQTLDGEEGQRSAGYCVYGSNVDPSSLLAARWLSLQLQWRAGPVSGEDDALSQQTSMPTTVFQKSIALFQSKRRWFTRLWSSLNA